MSDTRIQLSFKLDKADWIPKSVREKMKEVHKNRINKAGEFSVVCQETSSQNDNYKRALVMIQDLIKEAEEAVQKDIFEANKMDPIQWQIHKKIRDGKEHELEKRAEAIKRDKRQSRERTKAKQTKYW